MNVKVTLQEITRQNWIGAVKLKVDREQENFVASNLFSIAQAKVEPYWHPMAIYADDTMVGFTMYGFEEEGRHLDGYWICRLMIDSRFQGKGYGKAAMQLVIDELAAEGAERIFISFEPENTVAESLYSGLGFEDTGEIEGGERVFCLTL